MTAGTVEPVDDEWVRITGHGIPEGWRVEIRPLLLNGNPKMGGLRIELDDDAYAPIRAQDVGRTPFIRLLRLAADAKPVTPTVSLSEYLGDLPKRPFGGSREHSQAVAAVFTAARAKHRSGIVAIADTWHVGHDTASRWVQEARQKYQTLPPWTVPHGDGSQAAQ